MQNLLYLAVVFGTAVWVAVDSSRLGAKRGALDGGMLDMGPVGWFFAVVLLWIVTLPCYLTVRPKLVRRANGLALRPQFAGGYPQGGMPAGGYGFQPTSPVAGVAPGYLAPQPVAQQAAGPIAGWYPSPDGHGMTWWDGAKWTADRI